MNCSKLDSRVNYALNVIDLSLVAFTEDRFLPILGQDAPRVPANQSEDCIFVIWLKRDTFYLKALLHKKAYCNVFARQLFTRRL